MTEGAILSFVTADCHRYVDAKADYYIPVIFFSLTVVHVILNFSKYGPCFQLLAEIA